jgi:hypothetical protein
VLRRIFWPKRGKVKVKWRRLHNEELHDLQSSLNIVRVIKSRRMRWAGHVVQLFTGFWWAGMREGDCLEGQSLEGKIILKWIFKRWVERNGLN